MIELFSLSIGLFSFSSILAKAKEEKLQYKLLFISILLSYSIIKISSIYANDLNSFVYFLTIPLTIWICFKLNCSQIIYSSLLIFFSIALIESILYLIPIFSMNLHIINSNKLIFLFVNVFVYLLVYLISLNSKVQNLYKKLLKSNNSHVSILLISILLILISFFAYKVIMLSGYTVSTITVKVFPLLIAIFILIFIYIIIKHYEVQTINNVLYEYLNKFESIIEQHEINNHEHYNQLAAIKGMNKNKKIDDYIASVIAVDSVDLDFIKDLPSPAIKGLFIYKKMYYESLGVQYKFIISKKLKNLEKIHIKKEKYLINLLGIYLDNASEEALKIDKTVTVELYLLNRNLNIVISNKTNKNLNLAELKKKNVSSKAKHRGKGLYLAESILSKTLAIESKTKVIGEYFIQHIKIKEDVTL